MPPPAPSHEKTLHAAHGGGYDGVLHETQSAQHLIKDAGAQHWIFVMPEKQTDAQIDWRDGRDGSSGTITVRGQCAVFIPKQTRYTIVWRREAVVLRFHVDDDAAQWRQSVRSQPLDKVEHRPLWELARRDAGIMDLVRLFVESSRHQQAAFPESYFKHLGAALSYHLLGALLRENDKTTAPAAMDAERLNRVFDYIEQNLHGKISVKTLAGIACMSLTHFKRLFKAGTGMPGRDYVFKERMRRAQTLLRKGNMRIAEVAALCGFCDQSYLDRCFRRHCQCSPGDFLRNGPFVPKNGPSVQSKQNKTGHNGGTL